MAAKVLALFALLALSVSAATAVTFPQYFTSPIAFEVNNPYALYNPLQQAFASSISPFLAMTIQQQYWPRQIFQQQILQQVQQQLQQVQQYQVWRQVQQQQQLSNIFNTQAIGNPTAYSVYGQRLFSSGACF
uniref:Putative storage protein n=1 Tax=Eragrostis tef TaxID=110835 RepID=A0A173G7V3_ERATE|nr:putative storage protein [Eragrostis tef]